MIVRAIPSVDELVNEHFGLVAKIVRNLSKLPCVRRLGDEALSVGNFALVKAAQGFDITQGVKFKTYATTIITRDVNYEAAKHESSLGIALVTPDVLPGREPEDRRERVVTVAAQRKRKRLQQRLGINERN